ncbi:uncharacterized protein MAM_03097 [Metarhizium album ARSEF 1941]|uniref:Uncharacterized protein n=1 Tax=Metarhizium album (strain ARSEF 1941) TaxID=1081103 RepID=A0A0B2X0M4_METAS|nr:uncharacterized protein MAM_03097 [Metarhizium album ARSEF 1941]KHN99399.1 hypothetical protein MAM_03097 [Metarhizium album ARSEF 1941]
MSSGGQLFIALLRDHHVKSRLLLRLSTPDVASVRQLSSACCNLVTKDLFTRVTVTFTPATFTKPARVAALNRIGHHVEHLTFQMAHSKATFLPPLVHPLTGHEVCFLYTPHTSLGSALTRRKYANTELGDILTQQYPPLFHAATNVPSFIRAFHSLPNMRHLTVRCPGQDPRERYRRDVVDYALISLRIAVERAPLDKFNKLSLSSLHPSAFNYLRHTQGFGSVPSAGKRWRQVKKLSISVESWDFYGPCPGLDHLKIMDDYVRFFAPSLDKFSFSWIGARGPCPVALSSDPLFAPPRSSKKLFHEVTSPMSPLPARPPRVPVRFPGLRHLQIRNVAMNAPQLSDLIRTHSATVKGFDFENVMLTNNGNWEDALAPLGRDDCWKRTSTAATATSDHSSATCESDEELPSPSPSAAVQAASRELLHLDLGASGFSDEERTLIERLWEETSAAAASAARSTQHVGFTTKLRKKRTKRRRGGGSSSSSHDEQGSDARPSPSRRHDRKPSKPKPREAALPSDKRVSVTTPMPGGPVITAPILAAVPHPVILQPTVYDPACSQDDGISAVQRNIEQEEAHRLLAQDAAARVSALQKAKAAVLSKLSKEFSVKKSRAADAVAACRLMTSREWTGGVCATDTVVEDACRVESRSALVPLMFRRS